MSVLQRHGFFEILALLLGLRIQSELADRVNSDFASGLRVKPMLRLIDRAGLQQSPQLLKPEVLVDRSELRTDLSIQNTARHALNDCRNHCALKRPERVGSWLRARIRVASVRIPSIGIASVWITGIGVAGVRIALIGIAAARITGIIAKAAAHTSCNQSGRCKRGNFSELVEFFHNYDDIAVIKNTDME